MIGMIHEYLIFFWIYDRIVLAVAGSSVQRSFCVRYREGWL